MRKRKSESWYFDPVFDSEEELLRRSKKTKVGRLSTSTAQPQKTITKKKKKLFLSSVLLVSKLSNFNNNEPKLVFASQKTFLGITPQLGSPGRSSAETRAASAKFYHKRKAE